MKIRHCEYCGADWVPRPGRTGGLKWHDCQKAQEDRKLKRIECVRKWRERHPDYPAQHQKGLDLLAAQAAPYKCQRCGRPTHNRINCPICWAEVLQDIDAVEDCLGYELGSVWL